MSAQKADPRLVSTFVRLSRGAIAFTVAAGCLVLVGWALDIALLKSVGHGWVAMKPNTAFAFILAGVALWALQADRNRPVTRIAAGACSAAVAAVGLLTLGQDLAGRDLGIDQLLFKEPVSAVDTGNPGRMAPATALNFLLIGGALQLLVFPGRRRLYLAQALAVAVLLVSALAALGYAYGVASLYRVAPYTSMAMHTSVVFIVLSLAVLCARAGLGWTSVIVSRGAGGVMLRNAWLPSIVFLFLFGSLRLHGEKIGLYSTEFGLALMVLLAIALVTAFFWRSAISLDNADAERERAEKTRAQLAAIVESSQDAIISRDLDGKVLSWNAGAERMLGYSAAEAVGQSLAMIMPAVRPHEWQANTARLMRRETVEPFESVCVAKDGRRVVVQISMAPVRDASGNVARIAAIYRDVTEREQAEEARAQLAAIVETSGDAIVSRALDGTVLTWNAGAENMFGYTAREAIGRNISSLIAPPELRQESQRNTWLLLQGRPVPPFETVRVAKGGRPVHVQISVSGIRDHAGNLARVAAIFRDISVRKKSEERIEYLAQYDTVTGLPNRRLFKDRLSQAIARARRAGSVVSLLLLDLDRFKQLNETLGHGAGDQVLQAVTARLHERLREADTIARLGGDEFAVILENVADAAQASRLGETVVEAMDEPLSVNGEVLFVTASVGMAVYPADADGVETLVEHAEVAMYQAKQEGGNAMRAYGPDQRLRRNGSLSMDAKLRRAIERDELLLHFQPKVDLRTGAVTGAEALVRWRNPELGLVPPAQFIPLAEETGLIVPIGEWVLHKACTEASAWQRHGFPIGVAVNLSARQFHQKGLCDMIARALDDAALEAGRLELEITESMIMHRPEQTIATLKQMRDMGLTLSVDDFGTGYSSLSYLKRFPIHKLKVDQSFVRELHQSADDAAIVRAIIALAASMNLKTVAEGVETEQQLAFLAGLNCDEYQGYYFSKPLPGDEFLRLLRRHCAANTAAAARLKAA